MRILLSTLAMLCLLALPYSVNAQMLCAQVEPQFGAGCELIWPENDEGGCFKDAQIRCLKEQLVVAKEKFDLCLDRGAALMDGECSDRDDGKANKKRKRKGKKKGKKS